MGLEIKDRNGKDLAGGGAGSGRRLREYLDSKNVGVESVFRFYLAGDSFNKGAETFSLPDYCGRFVTGRTPVGENLRETEFSFISHSLYGGPMLTAMGRERLLVRQEDGSLSPSSESDVRIPVDDKFLYGLVDRMPSSELKRLYGCADYLEQKRNEIVSSPYYALMRECVVRNPELVDYLGSEVNVLKCIGRVERLYPESCLHAFPHYLDHVSDVDPCEKFLADSVFCSLPSEVRLEAFRKFEKCVSDVGGRDYGTYLECRAVYDSEGRHVNDVPVPASEFFSVDFNGRHCMACEVGGMYDNACIVGGRRIATFGPYFHPHFMTLSGEVRMPDGRTYGESPDFTFAVLRMDDGMRSFPVKGSSDTCCFKFIDEKGNVLMEGIDKITIGKYNDGGAERFVVEVALHEGGDVARYSAGDLREISVRKDLGNRKARLDGSVGRYISMTGDVDWPFDEDSRVTEIYRFYSNAKPSGDVIGGNYAGDFVGEAHWSRAFDFKVKEMPDFVGLRYIDFKDCTNAHALFKDGNSRPVESLGQKELADICFAAEGRVRELSRKSDLSV